MLRSFFIALSQNRSLRTFSERSSIGRKLSSRFVAGMTVAEALAVCERLNREGIAATLDVLGESVTTEPAAQRSASVYHELLDAIELRRLKANVSVKLTQMGMDFSPELAESIVGVMVEHAAAADTFVRVDMEGSSYTEATIAMTERLHAPQAMHGRVGTVLQAYLFRTASDVNRLVGQGIRIRLCKGAYKEPAEIAFPLKADVDANYVDLAKRLMTSGVFCGIATHDEKIVEQLLAFVKEKGVAKSAFEFQMLYGVRRDLQKRLAKQGFGVRVYVPTGWLWLNTLIWAQPPKAPRWRYAVPQDAGVGTPAVAYLSDRQSGKNTIMISYMQVPPNMAAGQVNFWLDLHRIVRSFGKAL